MGRAGFRKGMIVAVCVINGAGDSPSVMVVDTAKLSAEDDGQAEWLEAIEQNFEGNDGKDRNVKGEWVYPDDWRDLEAAAVEKFPVRIDGVATCHYECS